MKVSAASLAPFPEALRSDVLRFLQTDIMSPTLRAAIKSSRQVAAALGGLLDEELKTVARRAAVPARH